MINVSYTTNESTRQAQDITVKEEETDGDGTRKRKRGMVKSATPVLRIKASRADVSSRSLYDEIVNINVGTPKKKFGVYRGKLCEVSPFFATMYESKANPDRDACCKVSATSKGTLRVHLYSEEPSRFHRFTHWLYQTTIFFDDEDDSEKTMDWSVLVDMFLFAVRWNIPTLRSEIIHRSINKFNLCSHLPMPIEVNKLYRDKKEASFVEPFRKLLVDMFIMDGTDFDNSDILDTCSPQFLVSMVTELKKLNKTAKSKQRRARKKARRDSVTE